MLIAFIVLETFNLVLAIIILTGKMDNFIRSCYAFTPKDEEKYDFRRLRILMGVAFWPLSPYSVSSFSLKKPHGQDTR